MFDALIQDLLDLEKNPLTGLEGEQIYSYLSMICGDNLGSHGIGGFLESFSSHYFCRYCFVTKDLFSANPTAVEEPRTKENHQECVQQLMQDPKCNFLNFA